MLYCDGSRIGIGSGDFPEYGDDNGYRVECVRFGVVGIVSLLALIFFSLCGVPFTEPMLGYVSRYNVSFAPLIEKRASRCAVVTKHQHEKVIKHVEEKQSDFQNG